MNKLFALFLYIFSLIVFMNYSLLSAQEEYAYDEDSYYENTDTQNENPADTDINTDSNTGADADTQNENPADTDINTDSNTDADAGTQNENPTNTDVNTNSNTGADTSTVSRGAVPVFQSYRLPFYIDPASPELPPNHKLKKIRGTVWRGNELYIQTNKGQIISNRLYLFFDKETDAIAYEYVPYYSTRIPDVPRRREFIPLVPLLATNDFTPVSSTTLTALSNLNKDRIPIAPQVQITPPILDFTEEYGTDTVQQAQGVQEDQNTNSEQAVTEDVTENVTEAVPDPEEQAVEQIQEEEYQEYAEGEYENVYSINDGLHYQATSFFAQQASETTLFDQNKFAVNIGGERGGIFVHESSNILTPYTVIFLYLDNGMALYENKIENSFDVRTSWSETSRQARELYVNILDKKVNLKKFERVQLDLDLFSY
ncbi:MAG: hypothetical protein ACRCTQ_02165 [Brevinemataceae bacterium]